MQNYPTNLFQLRMYNTSILASFSGYIFYFQPTLSPSTSDKMHAMRAPEGTAGNFYLPPGLPHLWMHDVREVLIHPVAMPVRSPISALRYSYTQHLSRHSSSSHREQ